MTDQNRAAPSRVWPKLALAVGTATAAIAGPFVTGWESGGSEHLAAYHNPVDPPGIYTICDGDTLGVKATDRETAAGCAIRTDQRLTDFVKPVLAATPQLYGHPEQLAAAISLAYNIGATNYAGSTVAKRFRAGDWRGACNAFLMWTKADGQFVQGLANRRAAERQLCLKGLS